MFRRHPVLAPLTILYLIGVGLITLGPQPLDSSQIDVVFRVADWFQARGFEFVTYDRIQYWANIGMFFPVGLFFLLLFGRRFWWLALVVSFAMTCGIETAQKWIPGRVSDVLDVETNTTGAAIGIAVGLVLTIGSGARERRRRAARAAMATGR